MPGAPALKLLSYGFDYTPETNVQPVVLLRATAAGVCSAKWMVRLDYPRRVFSIQILWDWDGFQVSVVWSSSLWDPGAGEFLATF